MLLSPAVDGSPQVLRLSQQAEDALLLTSPADAGRSPLSPMCVRRVGRAVGECQTEESHADAAFTLPMLVKERQSGPSTVGLALHGGRKDEDRAIIEVGGSLLAVFDGHLGAAMSQFAADNFATELRNAALRAGAEWRDDILGLARLETEACAKDILSAAFRSCHEAARQRGKRGGTTALVFWSCLVGGRKIGFCANAGDSRAVLSVDGSARRLSVDHTADVPDEVKRVERVGGKVSLGLLADPLDGDAELKVTRGLGNFNLEPGFTPQPHVSGAIDLTTANFEFVILASDGLWDKVSDEEAVTLARNKLLSSWSPQQVAHALAHAAAERGSTDDTSVIIYSLAPKFAAAARASALSCGATRSASLEALAAGGVALGEAGSSNDSGFVSPQQAASCAVYSPPLQNPVAQPKRAAKKIRISRAQDLQTP